MAKRFRPESDPADAIDLFERAAEANRTTRGRAGSVVDLPGEGRLVAGGDVHDRVENLDRLFKFARIRYSKRYHLVLQELIHGARAESEPDESYRTLIRAAGWKVERPDQVHILMANHELSQANGEAILKGGISLLGPYDQTLDRVYGDAVDDVRGAMNRFIHSLPLAVRCANGAMFTHSLPSPSELPVFDPTVIDRDLTETDRRGPLGSAHLLIWGRRHDQSLAEHLGPVWGVKVFVIGHQWVAAGFDRVGDDILVINSDHANAVALEVDLSRPAERDALAGNLVRLGELRSGRKSKRRPLPALEVLFED